MCWGQSCFQKDDNLLKGNFRPVSILTSISKIYENVVNNQLLGHFYEIFNDLLSAFRKGHSCQLLLLKFVEDMKNALDQKHAVGALFMDLSKAFRLPATRTAGGKAACIRIDPRRMLPTITWVGAGSGSKYPMPEVHGKLSPRVCLRDLSWDPYFLTFSSTTCFNFTEKCSLYNYADDNSLSNSAPTVDEVLSNLKHDCVISIRWFKNNGMEANPNKFQFFISSPCHPENIEFKTSKNVTIISEPCVKALGVNIDNRLTFTEHVSSCCTKAARQLNAFSRISKNLDLKCRKMIFQSFVLSNFTCCPLVWHFCGKQNNGKIEKIQERALRILYDDHESEYSKLLDKSGAITMLQSRLNCIILEVFKSIHNANPLCIQDMFEIKKSSYSVRDSSKLVQSKRNTTTFGLRSFTYLGSKLWNDLPNDFKDADLALFKDRLWHWDGPNIDDVINFYV